MSSRAFLAGIADVLRPQLPADLAAPRSAAGSSLAQFWYGNRALHYEVWLRRRQAVLEIGLHFEADAITNERLLGAFRARERTLRRRLGADARFEEWDRGWTRIWESVPVRALEGELRQRVAGRLARYIATLEPLLREALPIDTPWQLARAAKPASDSAASATSSSSRSPRARPAIANGRRAR